MKPAKGKFKIGIVGCGASGSGIALSVSTDLRKTCQLRGLYDIDLEKSTKLGKNLSLRGITKKSLESLIKNCDCIVEAVNSNSTEDIIRKALKAKKDVLSMSVGKLLNAPDLFQLAYQYKTNLLIPSGAIAGMDAIKAASLVGIEAITLTTRKPPRGFLNNPYLTKKGIDPLKIKKEYVIFEGSVASAVKAFPQNINVAATLALGSQCLKKIKVRILTSPKYKTNSHEIYLTGKFGTIRTQTDNAICPDNPKTSYLAVLSGIQTLKQYSGQIFIGT